MYAAVYSSYFRKTQNIVSMIPHSMRTNDNCTSSVITTNRFQLGGLLKTILLLGFLCQRKLSFTHARFLLPILLDGIAQGFFSIDCIRKALILASCEVFISAGSQTAMAPDSVGAQP